MPSGQHRARTCYLYPSTCIFLPRQDAWCTLSCSATSTQGIDSSVDPSLLKLELLHRRACQTT